ncbi:preprotein translocase subunit, ATPase [Acetoanaerobium sticklandii]|uniref:Protein translocase subunit SecA n=1 Tax=Acetoanaerobium sticklandii (strain ATCC 12662 / DSM 519 / JCM 1433 / CCUG 9281 / NCIMB 10654 / HF) TaxID=499177 RepID=E3PUJ1_ACESD|nr:preprotein translocase subunit SecA [Acetoanaerobium sticklandii]CBH22429.1 preprotein translocase subunit, ATPase [Acetoanaerobium sticklandii]
MGFFDNYLTKKEIKALQKSVDIINSLEDSIVKLTDAELTGKTQEFMKRYENGETLDQLLPEAFAVAREASKRVLGMRHYDVQLMGGMVLHQGRIAEMRTGEGKTLVATLPVYLNALSKEGVHVVTVNDYLAKRDMEWMSKLYNFLGLTTGVILHGITPDQRRNAYNADITYGTNNEFGFDYLRDNMVIYKSQMVQRPLNYAIVDEVDSILVDEARTPLIISGQGDKSTALYTMADSFIRMLRNETDYIIDEKGNSVALNESGVEKAEKFFAVENITDIANMETYHHINQALRAHTMMKRDVDYVVKDGEIIIVDEFTGRLMFGRRYSEGLHQAIEAKEGLKVQRESKTLATITFQNYFRMYKKLSGMTGTAKTEEEEFKSIYRMDVVQIPTNKPVVRDDMDDVVYKTEAAKYKFAVDEIEERHKNGQPILVGTISIEDSEMLSDMLKKRGIRHEVLNAKNHEKEAEIVAQAGRFEQVTIATNMAGRGTDIILGGNPEFMTVKEMKRLGYADEIITQASGFGYTEDEEIREAREKYHSILEEKKEELKEEQDKVRQAGGLCIIGTERHESRRIDNQLRGRAGRQGDPGTSRFFISLEDELMRLFGSDRLMAMVEKIGMDDDMPIEHKMLSKSIEGAQKKVEGKNFSIRKHVLQYDDVMNKQREIIYKERRNVLEGEDVHSEILDMIDKTIDKVLSYYIPEGSYPESWDLKALEERFVNIFHPDKKVEVGNVEDLTKDGLKEIIKNEALRLYDEKEKLVGEERMRELERIILLQVVDSKWMDHIDAMDQLRQGIGLRAIGQEDPVRAYQIEGFDMFDEMIQSIQEETLNYIYGFQVRIEAQTIERKQMVDMDKLEQKGGSETEEEGPKQIKTDKVVGRNDLCPCGSGKKYKKCCGKDRV